MKIIHRYNLFPNIDFICFHTNKKQYLDILHKQKNKEMHLQMHNNDSDILLRSIHYSAKLQNAKKYKNVKKIMFYL